MILIMIHSNNNNKKEIIKIFRVGHTAWIVTRGEVMERGGRVRRKEVAAKTQKKKFQNHIRANS